MDYQVEIEEHPPQPYVAIRIECNPSDFEIEVERALTEVWGLLESAEVPPAGPPFCLVPQIRDLEDDVPPPSPWDLVVGFPVEDEVEAEDPVVAGILPGGKVATTVHKGRLDTLSTAYLVLQTYLASEGRQPNGSPWEIYLTDPVWEPDPEAWRTVVRWPIR